MCSIMATGRSRGILVSAVVSDGIMALWHLRVA